MSSRRKSHHDWYTSQRTLPALGAGARLASPVVMPVSASEARTSAMVVVHGPADGRLSLGKASAKSAVGDLLTARKSPTGKPSKRLFVTAEPLALSVEAWVEARPRLPVS